MSRNSGPASRAVVAAALGLLGAAVLREVRTPRSERTWRGSVLGVPYDLRRPTVDRLRRTAWDPSRRRVLVPRSFGLGWGVNLAALTGRSTARPTA